MNLQDLRKAQANYSARMNDILKERSKLYKLRKLFTVYFNTKRIETMNIDEYVIGKGEKTFCRRIERELDDLGRIIGANAFKFGVYYGRTKQDSKYIYRNSSIWGNNPLSAYNNLSPALIKLINDGRKENIEDIIKSKISPMFKGKILSTYYPERYLNIFSDDHLQYYLIFFDLDTPKLMKSDPVLKREVLIKFKNNDIVMRNWSLDLFSYFLYNEYPKRPVKKPKKIDTILDDYSEPSFPSNPIAYEIALNIIPYNTPNNQFESESNNSTPPNYEKINRLNKKFGDRGEKIVKDFEEDRLKRAGCLDLAKKVERVSLKSDNYGYDILSFDEDGNERFIEVKATRSKAGDANFFVSINELNTAKDKENYYLYVVFEILSKNPKIWILKNPFNPENSNINISPISYKVSIKTNKN